MRKRLVGPLLVAATLVGPLAGTAQAAVPASTPTMRLNCRQPHRQAKVWQLRNNFAAKNPCDQWLRVAYHRDGEGDSNPKTVNVEPGAQFNWRMAGRRLVVKATLGEPDYCGPGTASIVRRGSHGKAVAAPRCGTSGGSCGEDPVMTTFSVGWLYHGRSRRLAGVVVDNDCSRYMTIEWGTNGSYPDGPGATNILVEPGASALIDETFVKSEGIAKAQWSGGGCCFADPSRLTRRFEYVLRRDGTLVPWSSPSP